MSVISSANNDNNNVAATNSNLPHIRYCMNWLIRCHKDGSHLRNVYLCNWSKKLK